MMLPPYAMPLPMPMPLMRHVILMPPLFIFAIISLPPAAMAHLPPFRYAIIAIFSPCYDTAIFAAGHYRRR